MNRLIRWLDVSDWKYGAIENGNDSSTHEIVEFSRNMLAKPSIVFSGRLEGQAVVSTTLVK